MLHRTAFVKLLISRYISTDSYLRYVCSQVTEHEHLNLSILCIPAFFRLLHYQRRRKLNLSIRGLQRLHGPFWFLKGKHGVRIWRETFLADGNATEILSCLVKAASLMQYGKKLVGDNESQTLCRSSFLNKIIRLYILY